MTVACRLSKVARSVVLATTVLAAGSPLAGQDTGIQSRSLYEDLRMFSQVLNQIRINHPDGLEAHALLMAAIEGMVRAADPHSYVLPAVRLSPEREEAWRKGELYPVPIDFTYLADAPVVVSVRPGTDASELDIVPGDELVAIEGRPVTAESAPELDIVLAGKKGSRVALSFTRRRFDGSLATMSRNVKRERVEEMSAVGAALMLDERTGYVRLVHFGSDAVAGEFSDTLRRLERRGMERLVLDLRDNSGGLLEEAATVAGEFLPAGAIVYTAEGRKQDVTRTVRVERAAKRHDRQLPVVVVVNSGTASAAELVAGALQDHDRALIVGRPTFGKSLLMRSLPMTDGSLIFLVVGHIKTPCGRIVQRRYRDLRTRDYYRLAGVVQHTTGRPSCQSSSGRTLYGGGGIYPDVLIDPPDATPRWLSQIHERELLLRWVGGYLADTSFADESVAEFSGASLPSEVVENFLAFAAAEGVTRPEGRADIALLHEMLVRAVVWGRWGAVGYFTVAALHDTEVQAAIEQLEDAEQLLRY